MIWDQNKSDRSGLWAKLLERITIYDVSRVFLAKLLERMVALFWATWILLLPRISWGIEVQWSSCTFLGQDQRPDISIIWGYYILSISRPQKRILYPIHIQAQKSIWIYILYPLSKFLPALSQFLNNKKPDLLALQNTSPRLFTGSN
jgi:hypothetical protein